MPHKDLLKGAAAVLALMVATSASADLVLSTQPRGPHSEVDKPFEELAAYLSQATGTTVTYKYIDTWLAYAIEMQKGRFDIVFDGPAFVSWRMLHRDHEVLVKVAGAPGRHVVAVRKENAKFKTIHDLAGHRICGRPTPNLSSLVMLNEFPNPSRQPLIVPAESYDDAFEKMMENRCAGAVVSESKFKKLNEKDVARAVIVTEPLRVPIKDATYGFGEEITAQDADWLHRFEARSLSDPGAERWAVTQDGGDFDAVSGATATSRAVVNAVRYALEYYTAQRNELFTKPSL